MKVSKIYFIIYLSLLSFYSNSQDIHYTQANQVPMLINPAATGVFNGWERLSVNHKNQWVSSGTNFYTTSIAADVNLFKSRTRNRAHMGFGIQMYNDVGGDSKFGTRQVLLSVSGIVPLDDNQQLSGGLQFGLGQKFGDFNSLYFANQFDGETFNVTNPAHEVNNISTFMYSDFSGGIFYRYGANKKGFARNNTIDFRLGLSYFHVNKPTLNYRLGSSEDLLGKFVVHTSIIKDFDGTKIGVESFVNYYKQGPHDELLIGALLRYRIKSGGKITGFNRDMYLSAGVVYRYEDAIAPTVNFQFNSFNFGISYDVTIAKLGEFYRGGGIEFSLKFTNMDFALFKRRRKF